MVRLVSVNCLNLYAGSDSGQVQRYARVEERIAGAGADIVAVQEIVADGQDRAAGAARGLRRLAGRLGFGCEVDGAPAVAVGGGIHHAALMWRPGRVTPAPGSLKCLGRTDAGLWHSLVTAVFDLGGPLLRVGSVQFSPFDQDWCRRDACQVLRVMNTGDVLGLVGGDFNGLGATTVPAPEGGQAYYDRDPYQDVTWHPDHAYQLDADGRVERGAAVRWNGWGGCGTAPASWARRGSPPPVSTPTMRTRRGGSTAGMPPTTARTPPVTGYEVIPARRVGTCSDHLPVAVEVDPAALVA